jgi:hypothetical protein
VNVAATIFTSAARAFMKFARRDYADENENKPDNPKRRQVFSQNKHGSQRH